jgi:hypothetical protein
VATELHQGQVGQAAVQVHEQHPAAGQAPGRDRRRSPLRFGDGQALLEQTPRETASGGWVQGHDELEVREPAVQQPDESRLLPGWAQGRQPLEQHHARLSQGIGLPEPGGGIERMARDVQRHHRRHLTRARGELP